MRIRKDLNLYQLDEGRKRYTYTGEYLTPLPGAAGLPGFKLLLLSGSLMSALLVFVMGRLDLPSFRALYVILPFLGLVFAVGRCLWAAAHLFGWKERMTVNQFRISWKALQRYALLASALSALLMLAGLAFLIWGGGSLFAGWPLFALCMLEFGLSLSIYQALKHNLPPKGNLPRGFV